MAANGCRLRTKRKKLTTFDIIVFSILTCLFIILVVPFWSIIVTSFSTNESYIRQPFSLWPGEFTWANYMSVFARGSGLLVAYKNTVIISVIGTFVGMLFMTMAAYAMSRKFPGKRGIFMYFLFAMFFGGGTIPTYLNIKNLGLNNTFTGVIMLTLCSVGHMIILMKGFDGIPKEMEEAAVIDGASQITTFFRIMLPLIGPAIFSVGLLVFINCWNEYLYALSFMTDPKMRTVPVGIALLPSNYQLPWGDISAASVVATVPLIVLVLIFQKKIVAGLTTGGIKE